MLTILAYSFDQPARAERIEMGLRAVEAFTTKSGDSRDSEWMGSRIGIVTWSRGARTYKSRRAYRVDDRLYALSLVPGDWQKVISDCPVEALPAALVDRIIDDPSSIARLSPGFVYARSDCADEIHLGTDGLAFSPLYELRFDGGWVWSNRLAATVLFSGVTPTLSEAGWQCFSAVGWFMGNWTPLAGVRRVPGGTLIRLSDTVGRPRTTVSAHAVSQWVEPRGREADDAGCRETAQDLTNLTRATAELWVEPPQVGLSGGRDSRIIASAFLHAGVECRLRTNESLRGEGEIVRELAARTDGGLHVDFFRESMADTMSLRERALWRIRRTDAVGSSNGLFGAVAPPRESSGPGSADFSGAGGEIAHGKYYPANLRKLERGGIGAVREQLLSKLLAHSDRAVVNRTLVERYIDSLMEEGIKNGLKDAGLLDYFELTERIGRWSAMSGRFGTVKPLVSPTFIRLSFDATPDQKQRNELHKAIIRHLMPAWDGVPFYGTVHAEKRSMPRQRIWETDDAPVLKQIVGESDRWSDCFDPKAIRSVWRLATRGRAGPRHEVLLCRVVWRYFFDEYLAELKDVVQGEFSDVQQARRPEHALSGP